MRCGNLAMSPEEERPKNFMRDIWGILQFGGLISYRGSFKLNL